MSLRLRLLLLLTLAAISLLSLASGGCQQILGIQDTSLDPDAGLPDGSNPAQGGGGSGASSGSPDFSFTILTPNVTVPIGGKDVIEIEIRRTGGFSGEVTVTPMGSPVGLIIEPVTIPAAQTAAELVIGAEGPLALGNKVSFTLTATSGDLKPKTASVTDALVIGRPGAPDETFGDNQTGLAKLGIGGDNGGFFDLEVVGEQIVAAGWDVPSIGGTTFAVTRLTSSGSMDPTFAGGSVVKTLFGSSMGSVSRAFAVGHELDGRIVAMGWHQDGASSSANPGDIALERYQSDGSTYDIYFNGYGKGLVNLGGTEEVADGLILPNNRILVAGQRDGNLMVARADADGYLDNSFAPPNGYLTLSLGQPSSAQAIVVDSQSRILVAGNTGPGGQGDLVVARYLQDGQPDVTFGVGGQRVIQGPSADERVAAAAVLADGRILVAGDSNANGNLDFQVRRLLADGSSDPSFGTDGVATLSITGSDDSAEDMIVLSDGRILVVGNAKDGAMRGPLLARYTRNGKLDPHFGTGGVLSLFVGDYGSIHCAAVYPGHKVVIGGGDEGGSPGPGTFGVVARLWM
jgi:uncharacterized delta-60 repeat protein